VNAKQIWDAALERIEPRFSNKAIFNTWFKSASAVSFADRCLVLCVPSTFAKEQMEGRFGDIIRAALSEIAGEPVALRVMVPRAGQPGVSSGIDKSLAPTLETLPATAIRPASTHQPRAANPSPVSRRPLSPRTGLTSRPTAGEPCDAPGEAGLFDLPVQRASRTAEVSSPHPDERSLLTTRDRATNGTPHQLNGRAEAGDRPRRNVSPTGGGGMDFSQSAGMPHDQDQGALPLESTQRPWPASSSDGALNPRYTFSTFIVGKANRLAHAASLAVAESPGRQYNPLFLYGGVGLGKTHLLHAIGHVGEAAGLTVLYVTSERFTNEIINAIRFQKTEEFRAKYRQIDVLLVDDIQFIAGKESTEEEFFHTFNTLHNANKQIVVTSDRPPKAIHSLQDRLRSRFEWGLLADIQPPEYEHRLAILRSKAESLRFPVPQAVMEYIARPECSSVRELEGALNRVIAYAMLNDAPLTLALAMQALEPLNNDSKGRPLNPAEVLDAVARYYNVSINALKGKQRDREIVWPRQIAMYLMREETSASLLQIGAELGGRDHTTVMHGWEKVNTEIKSNDRVRREIAAIRESLRAGTRIV